MNVNIKNILHIFAARYLSVGMDSVFFYCIVHLLSRRQQKPPLFGLTALRRNKMFTATWAWAVVFILYCGRVRVADDLMSDGVVPFRFKNLKV